MQVVPRQQVATTQLTSPRATAARAMKTATAARENGFATEV
jgi:hypothetical protein